MDVAKQKSGESECKGLQVVMEVTKLEDFNNFPATMKVTNILF
jgi:hypothetical protein